MTLREIFGALARGSWIILAVTVVAAVAGYLYLDQTPNQYTASASARANTFLTTAIANGSIGGVAADLDPSIILTPVVLEQAATELRVSQRTLARSISYAVSADVRGDVLVVSATADTEDDAVERANAVLGSYVQVVTSAAAGALASLQAVVATTAGQIQGLQGQLAANPQDPVVAQNLTAAFATLAEQNAQVAAVQGAGALIVGQQPAVGGTSSQPSSLSVLALALVCGVLAGAGLVLILDRLDDRIRSAEEIEGLAGVAVLGELPYDRSAARRRGKIRLPVAAGGHGALPERLRSLRTSIQVLLPEGRGVIVLSSVEPGDGKTFVSANLAVAWSRAGRKVVLVGGDLRRPELGEYFPDVVGRPGLSDLLGMAADGRPAPTQAQIEETLVGSTFRGLRVLPAGSETDDSADLLGGENLPRILEFAGRIADVVVVDSPPALALADSSELARSADGIVLVLTVRRTRRRLLRAAVDTIRSNDLTLLGVVVNRSRRRLPRTYAGYYVSRRSAREAGALRGDRSVTSTAAPAESLAEDDVDDPEVDDGLTGRDRRLAALALDDTEPR